MKNHNSAENFNSYVYFILNFILTGFLVMQKPHVIGVLSHVCLHGLLYRKMFVLENQQKASAYVSYFLFIDMLLFYVSNFVNLKQHFNAMDLNILSIEGSFLWILLFIGGCFLYIWGWNKRRSCLWTWISLNFLGSSIILRIWNQGSFAFETLNEVGKIMLYLYFIGTCIWCAAMYITSLTNQKALRSLKYQTFIIFILTLCVLIVESAYINGLVMDFLANKEWYISTFFAWWKMIVIAIFMLFLAYVMYHHENDSHMDTFVFLQIIFVIVLSSVFVRIYIPSRLFLWFLYGGLSLLFANYEVQQKSWIKMNNFQSLALLFISILSIALFINVGLWPAAWATILLVLFLYTCQKSLSEVCDNTGFWLILTAYFLIVVFTYVYHTAFSRDILMLYMYIAISILLMMYIVNRMLFQRHKWKLRLFVALLSIPLGMLITQKANIFFDYQLMKENNTILMHVTSKDAEHPIQKMYYYWSNGYGNVLTEHVAMTEKQATLTIQGKKLTVVAEDALGIQSTTHVWIPNDYVVRMKVE